MLQPITLSATSAFDPSTSFVRAPVTARTTSSGRMVDVRRISSRIDSKRFVSGEIRSIVCAVALMRFSGRGSLADRSARFSPVDHGEAGHAVETAIVSEKWQVMLNTQRRDPEIIHLRCAQVSGGPKHRCANITVDSCGLHVWNQRVPAVDDSFDDRTTFIGSSAAHSTLEKFTDDWQRNNNDFRLRDL